MAMQSPSRHGYSVGAVRTTVLGLAKLLMLGISSAIAVPLNTNANANIHGGESPETGGTSTWVLFVASAVLVLAGGAFAGLTIALMGQDSIYLQVVFKDPHEPQQKNAKRVFDLLEKGKHWVLVTLLLSNVIVNESLPVVLDRCLGGGVAAVVGSTVLIVIFGEVLPQSVCVRYGLQIGGYMSTPVLVMMYIMAPVAWPTAKLLDWLLGEDHGTVYKKSGLKTLVTLHKSLGEVSERLNQDEVTIISAVLDLKAKSVGTVMTPMGDVFTLSEDAVLDEKTMDRILSAGYSRIPIHHPDNPSNFVGMLLVRILITYDPEDCKRVSDFALATLPETRPETSCLDILNFFQEGKSHMVLVSEFPGEDYGALGVVTLEDVIEELIGEEIIDESDVYIDIHKAIRRIAPAPKARLIKRESIDTGHPVDYAVEDSQDQGRLRVGSLGAMSDLPAYGASLPKTATFIMRRSSAGADGRIIETTMPLRRNFEEIREHLKHLGPSNPAANPKSTKYSAVKIKHAPPAGPSSTYKRRSASMSGARPTDEAPNEEGDDEQSTLLTRPSGFVSKDILQALRQSYGSIINESNSQNKILDTMTPKIVVDSSSPRTTRTNIIPEGYEQEDRATQTVASPTVAEHSKGPEHKSSSDSISSLPSRQSQHSHHSRLHAHQHPAHVGPHSHHSSRSSSKRQEVRSGSITENIYEAGGIRKIVLGVESESENDGLNLGGSKGNKSPNTRHSQTNSFLGSFVGKLKGGDGASDQENDAKHGDRESHASGHESEEDANGHDHAEAGPSTGGSSSEPGSSKDNKKKNRRRKRKGKS